MCSPMAWVTTNMWYLRSFLDVLKLCKIKSLVGVKVAQGCFFPLNSFCFAVFTTVVIRALNIVLPQNGGLEFPFILRMIENQNFNSSRDICFISRKLVKLLEIHVSQAKVKSFSQLLKEKHAQLTVRLLLNVTIIHIKPPFAICLCLPSRFRHCVIEHCEPCGADCVLIVLT